jgi:PAS domain S-box-containing protein
LNVRPRLLALALLVPLIAAAQERPAIVPIATVRNMASWTPSKHPVRIRGTVTVRDRFRNLTFVQDATAGLFVTVLTPGVNLSPGQVVELTGEVVMSRRGPTISGAAHEIAGNTGSPNPQTIATSAAALSALDGRLVSARGVVRRVESRGAGTEITLRTPEGAFTILEPAGSTARIAVDSVVAVQGVLSHALAEDHSLERRELLVPTASLVRTEAGPPADPYAIVEVPVQNLRQQPPADELVRRVRVTGAVTRQRPGRSLYLRTATGPIRVETDSTAAVTTGDRVEAVGFPDAGAYSPLLADSIIRRVQSGPDPQPVPASLSELMDGRHDADLVRVEGTFVQGEQGGDEYIIVLQDGDVFFNAQVPLAPGESLPVELRPGSRVRVTGICSVVVDSDRVPRSFRVLLRHASDVTVLGPGSLLTDRPSGAPWWAWISIVAALAALGGAGWIYRRGQAQEETIRRQLARESSLKARLDDLFERTSEILIVHDRRGRVSTINRAGEQATGYPREELRVLDPRWIFGVDYLDSITRMIDEGSNSVPRTFKSELVARKGARIPIDVHSRVLIGDGEIVGVTSIARDLSERDRLENELRQAQKMEAVGRLATGVAHDFNNLITVLLGYSDELIEIVPEGSEQLRAASEIRRAAERASGLTQQLLAFSRRQAAVAQTVDLNATVGNMEDLVRRLIGPEIRLEFKLGEDLKKIRGDAAQIGQVVMNLAVNARDAMPAGGALQIETANVELGAENIDVIPGPHVMLSVRDSGVGMTPEVRKQLFEPFFTTKETGQGTGLGLSMVHAIVRQNGGHVMVDSAPGQGSTFRVYFPVLGETADDPLPVPPPPHISAVTGAGVVLLAEDDQSVRRLVSTELERRGFTVIAAEDGRAALDLFATHKDRIDVIVTDVVMPRMNGADLAKAVEKMQPGVKLLFISGHPERSGVGLNPTGVTNLLMKPFTADTLATRIKELIAAKPQGADRG